MVEDVTTFAKNCSSKSEMLHVVYQMHNFFSYFVKFV